jgi:hypothetical protein
MSDTKNNGELIQWLRLLSLPTWVKMGLAALMAVLFLVGVLLIYVALVREKLEFAAAGAALLTVWLPIALIIVALVFGVSGAKALNAETHKVLARELPDAIQSLLALEGEPLNAKIKTRIRGCAAYYTLQVNDYEDTGIAKTIHFKVELNVKKVNFVVWLPPAIDEEGQAKPLYDAFIASNQGVLQGAEIEGYLLNPQPSISKVNNFNRVGCVFIVKLDPDFLMRAPQRLYWANDSAFFLKGLLSGNDFNNKNMP